MQVAVSIAGPGHGLISIGRYMQLEPSDRPANLRCAGAGIDGRRCGGHAFAKALGSTAKAPHFAAMDHIEGCDEARAHSSAHDAIWATSPEGEDRIITRITLTPDLPGRHTRAASSPSLPGAADVQAGVRPSPTVRRPRRSPLRGALRVLIGRGYPPDYLISWGSRDPMPAEVFFVHLERVEHADDRPRGYWGRVEEAIRYGPTGAVHLQPRHGPRVVIPRATAMSLGLTDPAVLVGLPGRHILAVGTVRRSKTGHLYVLVNDRGAFTQVEQT
ncbi:hypothetical protein OCAE111667_25315 [Occultella aeris]|uniref:Uncharacterized protein n=1 Tax=Occultella aeris TaxID=2761496 RepID=A0A7M4DJE6_9MICO|nr:hypothetical protein HALOF300_02253 [Occultella aeris]